MKKKAKSIRRKSATKKTKRGRPSQGTLNPKKSMVPGFRRDDESCRPKDPDVLAHTHIPPHSTNTKRYKLKRKKSPLPSGNGTRSITRKKGGLRGLRPYFFSTCA